MVLGLEKFEQHCCSYSAVKDFIENTIYKKHVCTKHIDRQETKPPTALKMIKINIIAARYNIQLYLQQANYVPSSSIR